jgi:hypothetical protein
MASITFTKHPSDSTLTAVIIDGRMVGLIRKLKNTRTERHPYMAFLMDGPRSGNTNTHLGTFYVNSPLTNLADAKNVSSPAAAKKACVAAIKAAVDRHLNPAALGPATFGC